MYGNLYGLLKWQLQDCRFLNKEVLVIMLHLITCGASILSLYLIATKKRLGFLIGMLVQIPWAFALVIPKMYILAIPIPFFFVVNYYGWRKWDEKRYKLSVKKRR